MSFGPMIGVTKVQGSPDWSAHCPCCGAFGLLDEDQYAGRVSIECACGYHETHDHRDTPPPAAPGQEGADG